MKKSLGEVVGDAFFTFAAKYPFWIFLALMLLIAGLDFYGRFYRRVNTDNIDLMERWLKLESRRKRG